MKIEDRSGLARLPEDTVVVDAVGSYFMLESAYPPHKPWQWDWIGFGGECRMTQKEITMPCWTVGKEP